jgi:hypothetical protein
LPSDSVLSNDDWVMLQHLHDILKPFWKLTLRLEGQNAYGKNGAIWEDLPSMQVLINHLDNAQKIHTPRKSKPLNACIVSSLTKLREYYRLLDSCPAYAAAQVFNPVIKESHFERDWRGGPEGWIPTTREDIRSFWESEYKGKVSEHPVSECEPADEETDLFGDYIYQESGVGSPDEYGIYCQDRRWKKTPSNLF